MPLETFSTCLLFINFQYEIGLYIIFSEPRVFFRDLKKYKEGPIRHFVTPNFVQAAFGPNN